jgi:RNA polymerase sigma-70 factor (ECF subfamily)
MNWAPRPSASPSVMGKDPRSDSDRRFEAIYDAHYRTVTGWIRYLCGRTADQEDLVQEVFVVVYRRLAAFDGHNVLGWLYRITTHQVRDYRCLTWIKHIFRWNMELSDDIPSPDPTPAAALELRERQQKLEHLLSKLSNTLRATFVLFEIAGYTAEEIAEMQSLPVNSVRARIHRARKAMTALLEPASTLDPGTDVIAPHRAAWAT